MSEIIAWYIVLSIVSLLLTGFNFIVIQAISEILKLIRGNK